MVDTRQSSGGGNLSSPPTKTINPASAANIRKTVTLVETRVAKVLERVGAAHDVHLLVALSGGPDSVATLHALHRIRASHGFQVTAAHLNHCLRGKESERDERFVRELC